MSAAAPVDPLANALVDSGLVPSELLDAYLQAPAEVRRRCFDSGQTVTAGALLEVHPLADLFPAMTREQYEALRDDIAANGVQEPIWLYQGRIIDGKHRQRACIELGIDPPRRKYTGKDPLAFVVARNLRRRHLTESQRAMVAASIANMRQGERTDLLDMKPSANLPKVEKVSQQQAAGLLNVSERSLRNARKVRELGSPSLAEAVERGELAVSAAASIAQAVPQDVQSRIVEEGLGKEAARYIRTHASELAEDTEAASAIFELIRQSSSEQTAPDQPSLSCHNSPTTDWIEVSDHLPDVGVETLVFLPGTPDDDCDFARFEGPGCRDWILRRSSTRVTPSHWMPKPPPPTGRRHVR
jgi:ParB-like chromosome segregation protein Spo0J